MNAAALNILLDLLTAAPGVVKAIESDVAQYKSAPTSKAKVDAVLSGFGAVLATVSKVL